jgi:sugar lactone lactonase YvrE
VGDVDFAWTAARPDLVPGQFPDANPYGVLAGVGEHWVVDAGSNTLDRVRSNGSVDVVAFIPNPPASDAVPTCIERGPDGALYIGELTGGGNAPGSSVVWRYSVRDRTLTQWATGLTAVTGCGFGTDGRFYAVEFSTLGLDNAAPGTGALVRVAPHSTAPELVLGGLSFPGGFAAAGKALYFSDWSIAPAYTGLGSVKRVTLP